MNLIQKLNLHLAGYCRVSRPRPHHSVIKVTSKCLCVRFFNHSHNAVMSWGRPLLWSVLQNRRGSIQEQKFSLVGDGAVNSVSIGEIVANRDFISNFIWHLGYIG